MAGRFAHLQARLLLNRRRTMLVASNWLLILAGLAAAQGATALSLIIVARRVSPAEYGQYLAIFGLLSLLIVLANFGLESWLLAHSQKFASSAAQLWPGIVRARLCLVAAWLLGMLLLGWVLPSDAFPRAVVYVTALGLAFDSLSLLAYSALRSLERHTQVTLLQIGVSLALFSVTLMLPLRPGQLLLFAIARTGLSGLAAIIVLLAVGSRRERSALAPIGLRELLRSARPFVLAETAVAIYLKADLSIIGLWLGAAGAGLYGPALNLINITFMAPNALYFFVMPRLSRVRAAPDRTFQRMGLAQLLIQGAVGAALSLLIFALAPLLVQLVFGPAYALSANVLQLLSPIPFLKSLNFGLGAILTAGDRQRQRTTAQMLCALFNVAANLIVVGPIGIGGVAVVYTASEFFLFLSYGFTLKRMRQNWRAASSLPVEVSIE
jgi:O-antigen/teichoic acid export membrane protein